MRALQGPDARVAQRQLQVARRHCHHHRSSSLVAAPPLVRKSTTAAAAAATTTAEPPLSTELRRDPSAVEAIMQAATEFALRRRLREHASVAVTVRCAPGNGLLDGRFDAMAIEGEAWRTPLGMTARRLAVDIGALQVDYGALVTQRKVALSGARPKGTTTITLTAADLGAFMTHPLFKAAAAKAVDGRAFEFDPHSVAIRAPQSSDSGSSGNDGGEVRFEGVWAGDGRRYRVVMLPAAGGGGGGSSGSSGKKLRVGAQLVTTTEADGSNGSSNGNGADGGGGGNAPTVAAGIANFFTHLAIDLDGIELSRPALLLRPWGGDAGNGGNGNAAGGVLDIRMSVRIRAFPPLDMQF